MQKTDERTHREIERLKREEHDPDSYGNSHRPASGTPSRTTGIDRPSERITGSPKISWR